MQIFANVATENFNNRKVLHGAFENLESEDFF